MASNSDPTMERAFKRAAAAWPSYLSDSQVAAWKAWLVLSEDERLEACDRAADFAMACKDSTATPCSFGVYLRERRWKALGSKAAAPATSIHVPPFGPLWGAVILRELLTRAPEAGPAPPSDFMRRLLAQDDAQGLAERLARQARYGWPAVNRWYEQAASRKGFSARPDDRRLEALMEPVPVDGAVFGAWRALYERNGWPWLPDPGAMRVVYFPAGGPAGLDAFERAVKGSENDAGRAQAAE